MDEHLIGAPLGCLLARRAVAAARELLCCELDVAVPWPITLVFSSAPNLHVVQDLLWGASMLIPRLVLVVVLHLPVFISLSISVTRVRPSRGLLTG